MFNIIKIKRRFKGLFLVLRLHLLIPSKLFRFAANMADVSRWVHKHKNDSPFNDFYKWKLNYKDRIKLHEFLTEKEDLADQPINYLEFGVAAGGSFKWWINNNKHKDSRFFGFDTFTGLPENWGNFKAGAMSNGNKPPEIDDERKEFFQGLFQQTLPNFMKDFDNSKRTVMHLDADLYSSTLFVLTSFSYLFKKGDIILFDEFNVPMHEFKAFSEWCEAFYIEYEFLGGVNNNYQIAIKLK